MNSGRSTLDFVIDDSCSLVASSKFCKLTDINAISIARVDSWHAEYAFVQFLIHGIDLASAYAAIFVKLPQLIKIDRREAWRLRHLRNTFFESKLLLYWNRLCGNSFVFHRVIIYILI